MGRANNTSIGAEPWRAAVVPMLAIGAAATLGFALASVGSKLGNGPAVIIAVPLLALGALAVLRDPRVGILAVFVVMPVGFERLAGGPLQLIVLAVVGVAVLIMLRRIGLGDPPLGWAGPMNWLFALLLWVLIALPSAVDLGLALSQTSALVGGLLLMASILAAISTTRDVRRLIAAFVAASALIALMSISTVGGLKSRFGGGQITGRATGIFTEPNQLGALCAMAALASIGLTLAARRRPMKLVGALTTVPIVVGLLLSLSRGAWIGFVLGIVVMLVMLPRARRALLGLAVPLVIVAAALGAFAPGSPAVTVVRERFIATTSIRNPYDQRPAIWNEALREIADSPLTGQGPGGFPVSAARAGSKAETAAPDHAHNILLTWAAEAGIPAALLLIGFALHVALQTHSISRRLRPGSRDFDRATLAGLAAAATSIVGQGTVDYVLRGPVVFYAALAIIASLLAFARVARPAMMPPPTSRPRVEQVEREPQAPEPEAILWRA